MPRQNTKTYIRLGGISKVYQSAQAVGVKELAKSSTHTLWITSYKRCLKAIGGVWGHFCK